MRSDLVVQSCWLRFALRVLGTCFVCSTSSCCKIHSRLPISRSRSLRGARAGLRERTAPISYDHRGQVCRTAPHHIALYRTALYSTISRSTISYRIAPCRTMLCCIVPHRIVPYHTRNTVFAQATTRTTFTCGSFACLRKSLARMWVPLPCFAPSCIQFCYFSILYEALRLRPFTHLLAQRCPYDVEKEYTIERNQRVKKKRDKAATPSSDTRHPKRGSSTTAPSGAHAAKKARK